MKILSEDNKRGSLALTVSLIAGSFFYVKIMLQRYKFMCYDDVISVKY